MVCLMGDVVRFPLEERLAAGPRLVPAEPAKIIELAKPEPQPCRRCHGSQVVGMTMRPCPECTRG